MLMDICLTKFDIYQGTVASIFFKSQAKSCYPDFSKKIVLSDVCSVIHLVRRNIVSAEQPVRDLKKLYSGLLLCHQVNNAFAQLL